MPGPNPASRRDFSTLESYAAFMQATSDAIVANARDRRRALPLEPLVPMSSGYDSTAVAVLARNAGASYAMCIVSDRDGFDDSGSCPSRHLGSRPRTASSRKPVFGVTGSNRVLPDGLNAAEAPELLRVSLGLPSQPGHPPGRGRLDGPPRSRPGASPPPRTRAPGRACTCAARAWR